MHSQDQIERALIEYDHRKSIAATIRYLGYPSRNTLYEWIKKREKKNCLSHPQCLVRKTLCINNTETHPQHPSIKIKLEALKRCFDNGEDVKAVSLEIGYSRASIYTWRRKFEKKGMLGILGRQDDIPRKKGFIDQGAHEPKPDPDQSTMKALLKQIQDLKLEVDILKETINVLKKDPGVDLKTLRNQEKAVIIDTLTRFYSLPLLLHKLDLAKSSYYYCKKVQSLSLKYTFESSLIQKIFKDNYQCYGYRRIKTELNRQGVVISEKIVRYIMKSNGLKVISACKRAYSSYKGEISPEVPNLLKRNFKAAKPNEKWLTDISEFAIPAGKVYLSAIIDCYDGLAVSWNIDPHPDANLVNTTLDRAVETLNNERPIVHSDRGCHYRWPGWIDRTKTFELTRSMSKKGCSPDNSACEGFFGRMKNECFYNHSFKDYTLRMFIDYLNGYVKWYNEKRIKNSLGFCSPMEFRQMNGYAI